MTEQQVLGKLTKALYLCAAGLFGLALNTAYRFRR